VIITTSVFSFMVLSLFAIMRFGVRSWRNIESKAEVQTQLRKVELSLLPDLKAASYAGMEVALITDSGAATTSGTTSSSFDSSNRTGHGNVIWFLSAINTDGKFSRDSDGNAQWSSTTDNDRRGLFERLDTGQNQGQPDYHRAVLYYCIRPTNTAFRQRFQYDHPCESKPDVSSANPIQSDTQWSTSQSQYDDYCPHQWLIRKEIKLNPAQSEAASLPTLDEIKPFLTQPGDKKLTEMFSETSTDSSGQQISVLDADVLADSLVVFRAAMVKPEVLVDVKAFRALESGDILAIGRQALSSSTFTVQYDARVVPNNSI
jgi:hypothetical protein